MNVIPVIDLRHGVVVRAVAGDRANYEPIASPLFEGSTARSAVAGLMALHRFPVIYIADLDAIEGRTGNDDLIRDLASSNPAVSFWIDRNAKTAAAVSLVLENPNAAAVLGSESGIRSGELAALASTYGNRVILSLDHTRGGYVGDHNILADPTCWPSKVIVMTLANVGTGAGPDLKTISDIIARRSAGAVYAAGGIRHGADLSALTRLGVAGALVSSALHAQTITAGDL